MDMATLGTLLVGVGAVAGGTFTWLGKRGENAVAGYSSLTDNLQEELARKTGEAAAAQAEAAAAQAEAARLRKLVIDLGGDPS